ncbi:MAG: serine protease [Cyclobacteriaceae bacterium]|nr:MAG: serine protease [Cyclobacteriaceae bacterium]
MRSVLLSALLLVFFNVANAQVRTNFNNPKRVTDKGKFVKNFRGKSPYLIPARDIKALLEKEALENAGGEARPFKIAEAVNVDIDVVKEAEWTEEEGFSYGKFSIEATGAKTISANFDRFYLPEGTELYVYSENGEMITGPVTEAENNENNFWGSWVYKGGKLTVDFKTPTESKSLLRLHISSVAYGYKSLYVGNFGESSECNVNVLCAEGNGWENERNSVALILDASSTRLCSGALINNTCNLNIPYLLTADHCFDFDPNVAQWKFTFQAWSATCTPSQNANGLTFNGSTLRARHAGSDFCLVELDQLPPVNSGITFSGWSRASTASPSGVSITHPMGDVMKIATYNTTLTQQAYLGAQVWKAFWASGTVESGSSGGPLYNNDKRIIGQVKGIRKKYQEPWCR